MVATTQAAHRVVIVGGGFAGMSAARALRRVPARVTLIDRRNFHLFQPLLYQVATGALSPANIAAPLRGVLRRQKNIEILLAEVTGFDAANRRVLLSDGAVAYDTLIVAAGSRYNYFGHDEWEERAPSLKTLEDATEIRRRIFLAFEAAEREPDPERRKNWLTFVIVGGGPTGAEMAGALAEIARDTLRHDFDHINPSDAQILLVEGGPGVLSVFGEKLSRKASGYLERLGITVRTKSVVTDVRTDSVVIRSGESVEVVPTRTVIWAAGVRATPLSQQLAESAGAKLDRIGRVMVEPNLTIAGHPEIFVLGDMAHFVQGDQPLPGIAPVAMQQGRYVAKVIAARLAGRPEPRFRYRDKGTMATIGRSAAVAQVGNWRFSGFFAWLLWLFVHLMYLVTFANRVLVLFQWAFNYVTFNRTARLITGPIQQVQEGVTPAEVRATPPPHAPEHDGRQAQTELTAAGSK